MKIKDIKLFADKPTLISSLIIEDQSDEDVLVGRIFEGLVINSNIKPIKLKDNLSLIKDIWITENIGIYISFSNELEAFSANKTGPISMTSSDAKGLISCNKISMSII